jgi:Asp/Glu/hydantoin racemase
VTTIGFINASSGFTDQERALRTRLYSQFLPDEIEVRVEGIPDSPEFFDKAEHFVHALTAAKSYFSSLAADRFDVVVWAGAIDPGLAEARALAPIPIVGPGEASMYLAAINGRPLSIVTVDEHAVPVSHAMLSRLVIKPPIASVRHIGVPVRQLVQDRSAGVAAVEREARRAVEEDRAEAIYLGSMTLGTLGVDDMLRQKLGVAVFNPMRIATNAAVQLLIARGRSRANQEVS